MSENYPHQWVLIKRPDPEDYRIFGSWSGGYIDGDSWRLNSGIKSVTLNDDVFVVEGYSGSLYHCGLHNYGIKSFYNSVVLDSYLKENSEFGALSEKEAFEVLKEFCYEQ